jgi:hypothetical protein
LNPPIPSHTLAVLPSQTISSSLHGIGPVVVVVLDVSVTAIVVVLELEVPVVVVLVVGASVVEVVGEPVVVVVVLTGAVVMPVVVALVTIDGPSLPHPADTIADAPPRTRVRSQSFMIVEPRTEPSIRARR